MALPDTLNPTAITLAAAATAEAVDKSRYADLPPAERSAIIARGVAHLMAAGAYVQGGKLFLPTDGAV